MVTKEVNFTEKLVRWIWEQQLLTSKLNVKSGKKLRVIFPGIPNQEDGPDFERAKIELGGFEFSGDIEVDMRNSSWVLHKHNQNTKYNKVCLHVVMQDNGGGIKTENGRQVEVLEIKSRLKQPMSVLLDKYDREMRMKVLPCPYTHSQENILNVLVKSGFERFEERKRRFTELILKYDSESAIYIGIMESLGYVKNEPPFRKLATLVPVKYIKSVVSGKPWEESIRVLQASLLGVAGLIPSRLKEVWKQVKNNFKEVMERETWQYFKVRPPSFPIRRIEEICHFLVAEISNGLQSFLEDTFPDLKRMEDRISRNKMSSVYARTIILNVCLPVLSILYKEKTLNDSVLQVYEYYEPLPENRITRRMIKKLFDSEKKLNKELYYQGMIHIFKHYCEENMCEACPIRINT